MTTHTSNGNGVFEWLIGPHAGTHAPTDAELERWNAIVEAEEVFEKVVAHVARTSFAAGDDIKVRLALSAVLGAWSCVLKSREA